MHVGTLIVIMEIKPILFNEQNLKKEKSQKIFIQQKNCKFFTASIGKWTSIENEYTKDNVACFFEIYCFYGNLFFLR